MDALFQKPRPQCPICQSPTFPIWVKLATRAATEMHYKGVFACPKCGIRWRMEQPNTKAPVPICPTCVPNPVDMAIHLADTNKQPVSWVCWEDGTILRNLGGRAYIETFEVRAAM